MMEIEPFQNPTNEQVEAAYFDGLQNWSRDDRPNPYIIASEALSNLLAWAWDLGRRERAYVQAERTESDRVNAATLARLRAEEPRQARGWFGGVTPKQGGSV
jgi:hypothetical protein